MEKKCKCDLKVRWSVSDRNQLSFLQSEISLYEEFYESETFVFETIDAYLLIRISIIHSAGF